MWTSAEATCTDICAREVLTKHSLVVSPDAHPQSLGSTAGPGSSRSATRGVEVSSFLMECGAHFSSCPRVVADLLRAFPFWPPPTADSCARCFTCSAAHLSVVVVLDLEERVDAAVGLAAAHCSTGVSAALCPASSFFFASSTAMLTSAGETETETCSSAAGFMSVQVLETQGASQLRYWFWLVGLLRGGSTFTFASWLALRKHFQM